MALWFLAWAALATAFVGVYLAVYAYKDIQNLGRLHNEFVRDTVGTLRVLNNNMNVLADAADVPKQKLPEGTRLADVSFID